MTNLPEILPAPVKPSNLHEGVKWISGEGAGSWFLIEAFGDDGNKFQVRRFSPEGKLECEGTFVSGSILNLQSKYKVTYPSHCQKVTIIQHEQPVTLIRKS